MSDKTGTEVMFEAYDKLQTIGQLREELFPCLLEGGLLEQVNAQRKEAADEIERLREALRSIACAEGTCGCAISGIKNVDCFHGIARAALGEKK